MNGAVRQQAIAWTYVDLCVGYAGVNGHIQVISLYSAGLLHWNSVNQVIAVLG